MVDGLNEAAKNLALTGIKQRNPHAKPEQIHRMLAALMLGEELARKVYPGTVRQDSVTVQGEATRITLLVTQTLEQLGIPYAVCGSLASSLHGVMRSMLDVDSIADMQSEHIESLVEALSKQFYADDEMMRDAFDQMQLNHRRVSVIATNPEESVYVTSPEDTVLAKLEWYRMDGEVSDRQWRDTP